MGLPFQQRWRFATTSGIPLYQQMQDERARARAAAKTNASAANKRALAPRGDSRLFNSRMAVAQQLDSNELQLVVVIAIVFTPPLRPVQAGTVFFIAISLCGHRRTNTARRRGVPLAPTAPASAKTNRAVRVGHVVTSESKRTAIRLEPRSPPLASLI